MVEEITLRLFPRFPVFEPENLGERLHRFIADSQATLQESPHTRSVTSSKPTVKLNPQYEI